jgi:DNA glycosylase AlkZ-like
MPHLLARAALEGMIVLGSERGGRPTYVLLDNWLDLGRPPQERIRHASEEERDTAHTELVLRYLRAFGPATPEDMAAWSGLPMSKTRAAWERVAASLLEVRVSEGPAWMLKEAARELDQLLHDGPHAAPVVRLLPSFDTYLLGYRSRQLAVDPRYARYVHPGGGMLRPTVIVDGRAAGTWRIDRKRLEVIVEAFEPIDPTAMAGLEDEVQAIARFLESDKEPQLRYEVAAQSGDAD